ncbi:MAG: hypothetical protein QXJ75_00500 [Candidatus Bathyarchaeia archaeon]
MKKHVQPCGRGKTKPQTPTLQTKKPPEKTVKPEPNKKRRREKRARTPVEYLVAFENANLIVEASFATPPNRAAHKIFQIQQGLRKFNRSTRTVKRKLGIV